MYSLRNWPLLLLPLCAGCHPRAPSFLIFGSYFPTWLLGVAIGIPLTVLIRVALIRTGVDDKLPCRLLVYVCMAATIAMVVSYILSPR